MINLEQLKDLTRFLDGLTDLSLQTGIVFNPRSHFRPSLQVGDGCLALVIGEDEHGNATYAVTQETAHAAPPEHCTGQGIRKGGTT